MPDEVFKRMQKLAEQEDTSSDLATLGHLLPKEKALAQNHQKKN